MSANKILPDIQAVTTALNKIADKVLSSPAFTFTPLILHRTPMLKIDTSAFTRAAAAFGRLQRDQMPFALSRSMNDAVKATRNEIFTQTWPSHVHVRNPSFIRWALNVKYASKCSLTVEITDDKAQGRGHLGLHDTGGVKSARALQAVPGQYIRKNGRGVPRNQLPRALPNSFIKSDVIYQRVIASTKKGGKRSLKLMYVLKPSVRLKADVPFTQDFNRVTREELERAFPRRMEEAIRTAFRR
jgi:hypothetical protein